MTKPFYVSREFDFGKNVNVRQIPGTSFKSYTNPFGTWNELSVYDFKFHWRRLKKYGYRGNPFLPTFEQLLVYALFRGKDVGHVIHPKQREKTLVQRLKGQPVTSYMYHRTQHRVTALRHNLQRVNQTERIIETPVGLVEWGNKFFAPFPSQIKDEDCIDKLINDVHAIEMIMLDEMYNKHRK